jgi:enoyl-CoA hydratase/carnithine racemase
VVASDIVVAASDATIAFPEARRGLVSGLAAPLLVYRVGAGLAARLLLSATPLDAEQALRAHLFHEVVDNDLVWARSHEIAVECSQSAPESLQLTKRLLNETIGEHLGVMLTAGAAASATARTTEAATEGLAAFLEHRDPKWE